MRCVAAGLVEVVQYRREGIPLFAVELAQQLQQIDLMADIQPGGGLVEQHNGRFLRQHHRNPGPLPLAAGERIDALSCQVGYSGRPHGAVDRVIILFTPAGKQRLMRIAAARHQLLNGNISRRSGILRQQTDALRHLFAGIALDLLTVEINMAAGRRHQATQGTQQRRFPAAVRANDRGEMAVRNGHIQRFGDGLFAVRQG